ncbi:hypothetical protein COOONC_03920 [Cooperia oncophora]
MQHREEAQMGEDVETILANQLAATPVQQHIPQTFRGPFISRENEYRIAYDKHYTGGQNIHPHFLSKHYKELMFSYYDDDFARDYYVQDYTITADTCMFFGTTNVVEEAPLTLFSLDEARGSVNEVVEKIALGGPSSTGCLSEISANVCGERST